MSLEQFWQEIEKSAIPEKEYALLESLRRKLISSWVTCCGYSLKNFRYDGSSNFIAFNSYEPASFPFHRHECSRPCHIKPNELAKTTHGKNIILPAKFSSYVKKCQAAQSDDCCNKERNRFKKDSAFRVRRYCTKTIVHAILNQFNAEHGTKLVFGTFKKADGAEEDDDDVDRFELGLYTLPRGYQCCIQTHADSNCPETQYFLTVRAQHNVFNCVAHHNYGTTQARQLAHKGKRPNQKFSYYLLTDGFYYSFVKIDWRSTQEKKEIFNVQTELNALIHYATSILKQQSEEPPILPSVHHIPDNMNLLSVHAGKVAIVKYQEHKYALKFCPNERNATDNQESKAIQRLLSFDEKCSGLLLPQVHKFNTFILLVSDYRGPSLFSCCLCNKEKNQEIAKTVKADIGNALQYLHARNLVFVDVHPGNIVYQESTGAKLIDFECVLPLNGTNDDVRTIPFFKSRYFDSDRLDCKEDIISLRLVVHWILNTLSFRDAFYNNHTLSADEEDNLKEAVLKTEKE